METVRHVGQQSERVINTLVSKHDTRLARDLLDGDEHPRIAPVGALFVLYHKLSAGWRRRGGRGNPWSNWCCTT